MASNYSRAELASALEAVGVRRGDVLFSHSNVGYFGLPEAGRTPEAVFSTIVGAIQDVIGEEGTLVVPTFSYSFCRRQPFDPANTPSTCGAFTEMVRRHPDARRSVEPIFSVAALGARAEELTADVSAECFGAGSFWQRFLQHDGIICNLNFDAGSTFVHYVERCLGVPYRFDKLFPGVVEEDGRRRKMGAVFFCQDLTNPLTGAAFEPFDVLARKRGLARSERVGRGAVVAIRARDTFALIEEQLKHDPWLLTVGHTAETKPEIQRPTDLSRFNVRLPEHASMTEMIDALWFLPRDIVSDGYDAALEALGTQLPMTVHEYPTGSSCWTWIVPERWTCHEAYLESLDGRRLFSYADHPLHVVSYSLPFDGELTREELDPHLHVHPTLPGAIPFVYKYYERDWGLCCSQEQKDQLTDERYRVRIRSDFSYSSLKAGEVVIPGESEESIYLCAHLCHPAMVNDDLTGVVVGVDVMRHLMQRARRRYTYRFLIVPETVGSVAFLSRNEDLFPLMKGGLFLEMLALDLPHSLQLSFDGNTEVDRCFRNAFSENAPDGWVAPFDASNVVNDERQFNAPGVRVPMLSLLRVQPRGHAEWPFREYHSSDDNPEIASQERLEQTRSLVLSMIDTLERNVVPVNLYKGEVLLSRFGITPAWTTDPIGTHVLFETMYRIDGQRSILQIAEELNVPFSEVAGVVDLFRERGLVA